MATSPHMSSVVNLQANTEDLRSLDSSYNLDKNKCNPVLINGKAPCISQNLSPSLQSSNKRKTSTTTLPINKKVSASMLPSIDEDWVDDEMCGNDIFDHSELIEKKRKIEEGKMRKEQKKLKLAEEKQFIDKYVTINNELWPKYNYISDYMEDLVVNDNKGIVRDKNVNAVNLKMEALNIAGGLHKKIGGVNKLLQKRSLDLLLLTEVKLSVESYSLYENKFPDYKAFYAGHTNDELQNMYVANRNKTIDNSEDSEELKTRKKCAINKLKAPVKDGVLVLIHRRVVNKFTVIANVPQNRGIWFKIRLENGKEISLFCVYGPASKKITFWEEFFTGFCTDPNSMIYGDLNITIDKMLDVWRTSEGSMKRDKTDSFCADNMNKLNLIDAFRHVHKEKTQFSFFRFGKKSKEIAYKSRIDHFWVPFDKTDNLVAVSYKNPTELSPDHCELAVDINLAIQYEHGCVNKIESINIEQIDLRDPPKTEIIEDFVGEIDTLCKDKYMRGGLFEPENLDLLMGEVYNTAATKFGTRSISLNKKPKILDNYELKELYIQKNRLIRALHSWVPKLLIPINIRRVLLNSHPFLPTVFNANTTSFSDVAHIRTCKRECATLLEQVVKKIKNLELSLKMEVIQNCINTINKNQFINPKLFYKKTNFDKATATKSQLTKIMLKDINNRKINIEDKDEVMRYIADFWQKIYNPFRVQNSDMFNLDKPWYGSKKFMENREKIVERDLNIVMKFTSEEFVLACNVLARGKSPGRDRIPNELLTMLRNAPVFVEYVIIQFNKIYETSILPPSWKRGTIFTVYKNGTPFDPKNYRPIMLQNTIYKLFSILINNRLTTFLEKEGILSPSQGGFRKDKSTWNKIWTLINAIDFAKTKNQNLHLVYIDLAKAYDSVVHWGIRDTLYNMGFNTKLVNIINSMCTESTANVITAYGMSNDVYLYRGIPQGSPISPVLFDLFLDPLLHWINEGGNGFKMENEEISSLAFADDMALLANTNENLQSLMDKVQEFCFFYGLEINYDSRDKSVYTTNELNDYNIVIRQLECMKDKKDYFGKEYKATLLPKLAPSESYKYLGVYINLELNWSKQKIMSKQKLMRQLFYIENRCFNTTQTIEVINKVFMPAITYRMNCVLYDRQWCIEMDKLISYTVLRKQRTSVLASRAELYLKNKDWGLGLLKLIDLQDSLLASSFLSYGINSEDKLAKKTSKLCFFHHTDYFQKINEASIKAFNLQIVRNLAEFNENDLSNFCDEKIAKMLEEKGVTKINQVLNINKQTILPFNRVRNHFLAEGIGVIEGFREGEYNKLKEAICVPNTNRILPRISYVAGILSVVDQFWNLPNSLCDPGDASMFWVFVDGSCDNNKYNTKASFGVYFGQGCELNASMRTNGDQTTNNSEIQAIEHALMEFPLNKNLTIFTDSAFAYFSSTKFGSFSANNKRKTFYRDVVRRIVKIVEKREKLGAITVFEKIYSHTNDRNSANITEAKKRLLTARYEKMALKFQGNVNAIVLGNDMADILAKEGLTKGNCKIPLITKEHDKFILQPAINTNGSLKKAPVILDRIADKLKSHKYEQLKINTLKIIKNKRQEYYNAITSVKTSAKSIAILKNRDFSIEKHKMTIFKLNHEKFFTKDKIIAKISENLEKLDDNLESNFTYYIDKYGYMEDGMCALCKREIETNEHLFSFNCPKLKKYAINLSDNINQCIKEAILRNNDPEKYFKAEGIIYEPLKHKIRHWRNERKKDDEPQFYTKITKGDRDRVKIPMYNDWFNTCIVRGVGLEAPPIIFDLHPWWGSMGALPTELSQKFKEWGVEDEELLNRLVISIQVEHAKVIESIWRDRCSAMFRLDTTHTIDKESDDVIEL